ncbi:beta-galactosidase [Desulfurococcus amylolyticus]|uniref:beta-galactosidase n=1 Tax=Desulfurococcus amylolyticus TaxID=94694 RepID=UPI0005B1E2B7|nr:beta-galactosidase [Desulfurococcus amylolyticus]
MTLLCGEIHYFRVPKHLWRDRLLKLKRAGGNCVSTYIPWNWHDPREKVVNFTDGTSQWHVASYYSRDLASFLELAGELGLRVIARPGPYICSEWDSGGHPNWIYTKAMRLRSLDPGYFKHVVEWYNSVLNILKPYVEREIVIGIQVENEYFWGNEKYIEKLAEIVEEKLPGVLVFTNEDPYLTRIPNTIDLYPSPWDMRQFDDRLRSYLSSQPGLFKMIMELEGGWFKSSRYGYYPTNRLSIPPEWTEILLKTAVGMGLNNINIYMFHGGSNPGYYTAKYLASSYDFEACIREWGELSERYYRVKRVFTFLNGFQELVTSLKPGETVKTASTCSELLQRVGDHGKIAVLRNTGDNLCYQRLINRGEIIPMWTPIRVPPRYAKIVLLDLVVEGTPFKLVYTSGEALLMKRLGDTVVMIIYGDHGEYTETAVEVEGGVLDVDIQGDVLIRREGERAYLVVNHTHGEHLAIVKSTRGQNLLLIFTCRCRAEKTWIVDEDLVLISNIYYIGDSRIDEGKVVINAELDEDSCGRLLVVTSREIEAISLEDLDLDLTRLSKYVYATHIPLSMCRSGKNTYHPLEYRLLEDPVFHTLTSINPSSPLEKNGFYENGIYVYRLRLHLDKKQLGDLLDKHLALIGFSDYAVVSINNEYAGSGYHYIEMSADSLREGVNEVTVILESTGHPNDGLLYVPNGIYGGVYLGRVGEIRLYKWRKTGFEIPYGPGFDLAEFIANPEPVIKALQEQRSSTGETYSVDSPGLYITEFKVDDLSRHYVLDPGLEFYYNHYYRILLFVNKVYVGPLIGPIDITRYLKPGVNEVALLVEWGVVNPVIGVYQYKVDGEWFIQEGLHGLIEEWFRRSPRGETAEPPILLGDKAGRVIWVNTVIPYEKEPTSSSPVKLEVDFWGCRILVFVNGEFIGRISDDSPERELYVPETAVRRGLNNITLLAIVTSRSSGIRGLRLKETYVHERKEIVFKLGLT